MLQNRSWFGKIINCGLLMALLAPPVAAQLSSVKTVFTIVLENQNWSSVKGSPSAPYINNTLLPMASHAEQYYNPPGNHPSLPNYLWLEAGTSFGITDGLDPSVRHQATTAHLVTQLQNAGIPWKSYDEDIDGTTCPLTSSGLYAVRHNPFVYFDDVTNTLDPNSAYCISHIRPYTEFSTDLANNNVARYVFITPNLCHDGHDNCSPVNDPIRQADIWLSTEVPKILNSNAYRNGGALFICWDEALTGDGPIGMIVVSPFAKGSGYSNAIYYTHSSTLRTFERIFGVPLLGDAVNAADLSDLFNSPASTLGLSITSPVNGATISGTTSINTSVTPDIVRTEFYIDNAIQGTVLTSPFNFNLDTTRLTNGAHTLTVVAYDAVWRMKIVSVSVTVNNASLAPPSPTLSLTVSSPANGSTISGVTPIGTIVSSNVVRVEFYVDNIFRATMLAPPFNYNLDTTTLTNGGHTITVVAYDAVWNMKIVSVNVVVSNGTVTQGVTLSVTSPSSGATISGLTAITTAVSASVVRVEFYVDNVYRATALTAPFSYNLDTRTLTSGGHTITVVAYDALWNMKIVSVPVTVAN
jgi:phosphatidylinositol-3-phosphatase